MAHPVGRKDAPGPSGGETGENGGAGRVGKVDNDVILRGRVAGRCLLPLAAEGGQAWVHGGVPQGLTGSTLLNSPCRVNLACGIVA